jgi:Tfp pilus assembly protein PilN
MKFVLVMWAVWGVLVVITAALYLYRSRLQRDEEDQIFLDDSFSQEKAEQAQIAASVSKIEPTLHIFEWVVAAVTLFVIVYYIRDIVNHI